tara:strand:- start:3372 stop:3785 length:414 start_codon:yes stop_codon:yes gene_type:complete
MKEQLIEPTEELKNQQKSQEAIIWSLDLMVNLFNCSDFPFEEKEIQELAQMLGEKIDEGGEIVGVVNEFGKHEEAMKGLRLIHETQNSLITAHFVEKTKNVYLNIHSCAGYRPSEAIALIVEKTKPESYSCQKVFRD